MTLVGTRRTFADWQLLAAVAALQIAVAAALRIMPLAVLRTRAARSRRLVQAWAHGTDDRVVWAIQATGRRLGRLSSCLVRAIAAESVLDLPDRPVFLTIGVRRRPDGSLAAHAWLADADRVLIGAEDEEYSTLVEWSSASA